MDDPVQPMALDVAERHVPLVVRLIAGVGTGEVRGIVGEVPEHESGATQQPFRPRRRGSVPGPDHDPQQRRRHVPQRVREPRHRRVLRHAVVGPRDGDDQEEAEVGGRRRRRRGHSSVSVAERTEKRGADAAGR